MHNNRALKLKIYSIDTKHDRLISEFNATKHLSKICNYVNTPINKDDGLAVGIFDWIEGSSITTINQNDINLCLNFLKSLNDIKSEPQFTNLQYAGSACLSGSDIECQIVEDVSEPNLCRLVNDVDGIFVRTTKISETVIQHPNKLKVVSRHGVGFDTIDLKAPTKRGIPLALAVGRNDDAISEQAMFLILALSK